MCQEFGVPGVEVRKSLKSKAEKLIYPCELHPELHFDKMFFLARNNFLKELQKLLNENQNCIEIQNIKDETLLMTAARGGAFDVVHFLIGHQKLNNLENKEGKNALWFAVEAESIECTEILSFVEELHINQK